MIDLSKFCGSEGHGKYDLSTPWAQRGWLYASDGAIMVRVLTDLPDEEPTPIKRPERAGKFFDPPIEAIRPWPGAEAEVPGTQSCMEPVHDDDDGFDPDDYDEGDLPCEVCGGDGILPDTDKKINGYRIRGKYCRMIESLPNVRVESVISVPKAVRFLFDGGEGCVMMQDDEAARKIREELDVKLAHAAKVKA